MLSKSEIAEGIRFAGKRAAAAAETTVDWDVVLGNVWTTHQMFSHVAAAAGAAESMYPMLETPALNGMGVDAVATGNSQSFSERGELERRDYSGDPRRSRGFGEICRRL